MKPLQVIASLWIHPGQCTAFEAYERKAVQIMRRHGGALCRSVRASDASGSSTDAPFEVHLLEFPSLEAFESCRSDPELLALNAERTKAISRTEIFLGTAGPMY